MREGAYKIGKKRNIQFGKFGIYFVVVFMVILATTITPNFLTGQNILNIFKQMAVIIMVALGETMLIIMGATDLAAGSELALAGIVSIYSYFWSGSLIIALLVGIFVGALCGSLLGLFVTKLHIPYFIAGLAMSEICRGTALLLTGGYTLYNIGDYTFFGQSEFIGIPMPFIFAIIVAIITWVVLNMTRQGRYIYAVGGNKAAAHASGINVDNVIFRTYLLHGMFVGLAGVVLLSRLNSGLPDAGVGYEFQGITAAVIGGTSMLGGIGSVQGTLAGAFIVGIMQNVMNLLAVESFVQQVVKGGIILAAVAYDMNSERILKRRKPSVKTLAK